MKQEVLIALGANLPPQAGPPERTLAAAIAALRQMGFDPIDISRFYRTPCFPAGAGPDYVNAAARFSSSMEAEAILSALHQIENDFGRQRERRWGQRSLDLDLIALGDLVLPDQQTFAAWQALALDQQMTRAPEELIVPHPRLQDRAFVLVPLGDVAPDWHHPVLGMTVREMVEKLDPARLAELVAI